MPCPPSYEEIRVQRAQHSLTSCRAFEQRLQQVMGLLRELVRESPPPDDPLPAVLGIDDEAHLSPEPDWWGNAESSEEVLGWVDAVLAEEKRLEEALCEASTTLVNLWDNTPEPHKTPGRSRLYQRAEALHRAHREADRQEVLRNIKRIQGFTERGGMEFRRLKALAETVRALPIEVLLRDRAALPRV